MPPPARSRQIPVCLILFVFRPGRRELLSIVSPDPLADDDPGDQVLFNGQPSREIPRHRPLAQLIHKLSELNRIEAFSSLIER
jgi:hypothetical protein